MVVVEVAVMVVYRINVTDFTSLYSNIELMWLTTSPYTMELNNVTDIVSMFIDEWLPHFGQLVTNILHPPFW